VTPWILAGSLDAALDAALTRHGRAQVAEALARCGHAVEAGWVRDELLVEATEPAREAPSPPDAPRRRGARPRQDAATLRCPAEPPADPLAHDAFLEALLGRMLHPASEPEDTARDLLRLVALAPTRVDVLDAAAGTAWRLGYERAAGTLYREALRIAPRDAVAQSALHALDREDRRARARAAQDAETLADLLVEAPDDAEVQRAASVWWRARGDLARARDHAERAVVLEPDNAWARLALAEAALAQDDPEEARRAAQGVPDSADAEARRLRDVLLASALRRSGDAERAAGRLDAAEARYRDALARDPEDPWTHIGVAGSLMARERWSEALASYATLADHPDPDVRRIAERGRAGALEAMDRAEEALGVLDALARSDDQQDASLHAARDALAARVAVRHLDRLRREGHPDDAHAGLEALRIEHADSADVHAAIAAVRLDRGDAAGAADSALRALAVEGRHPWALETAVAAAAACDCAQRVRPWIDAAAIGGSPVAERLRPRVHVLAQVDAAREARLDGRRDVARAALLDAERRAGKDEVAWAAVAAGWEALGATRRARAFRTRQPTPSDAPADPPVAAPEPMRRAVVRTDAATGVLLRAGVPGLQQVLAGYAPVRAALQTPGGSRWRVEAVPTWVSDGVHTDTGTATTLGWSSPDDAFTVAGLDVGTSPIGFAGGAYPTWMGRLRLGGATAVTMETLRAPLHDSLPAWAGAVDPARGTLYGQVGYTGVGGGVAWVGLHGLAGIAGHTGRLDAIAMERVLRQDAAVWAGMHRGAFGMGLEGAGMLHDRQADAFETGAGAVYTPLRFATGALRVDTRVAQARWGACAAASAGLLYADGDDNAWFAAGRRAVGRASLRAFVRLGRTRLVLDASTLRVEGGWHQEVIGLQFEPPAWSGAPTEVPMPATTLPGPTWGLPGADVVRTEEPC
jgi:tetratricopeptide (TPR) repeat protein